MSRASRLSDLIGALELGTGSIVVSDGALEATAGRPYTDPVTPCIGDDALEAAVTAGQPVTVRPPLGFCIGDGALEASGGTLGAGPTTGLPRGFPCTRDDALEASVSAGPVPTQRPWPCIGDDALMASVTADASQTFTPVHPMCIGDDALEESVSAGPVPTQRPWPCIGDDALMASVTANASQTFTPVHPMCVGDDALESAAIIGTPIITLPGLGCIGDGALEASAIVGPTPPLSLPRCYPIQCIGDDALEASVTAGSPRTALPPYGRCIGDGALEAAGGAAAGPTQLGCPPSMMCRAPAHHAET